MSAPFRVELSLEGGRACLVSKIRKLVTKTLRTRRKTVFVKILMKTLFTEYTIHGTVFHDSRTTIRVHHGVMNSSRPPLISTNLCEKFVSRYYYFFNFIFSTLTNVYEQSLGLNKRCHALTLFLFIILHTCLSYI